MEGLYRLDSEEKPPRLHIRVVQRLQPPKAQSVHVGLKHFEHAQHLDKL